jgi:hypothetical protein
MALLFQCSRGTFLTSVLGLDYTIWIWVIVECDLSIICASIPPLHPGFRKYLPVVISKLTSLKSMSTSYYQQRNQLEILQPDSQISHMEDPPASQPAKCSEDMEKGVLESSIVES